MTAIAVFHRPVVFEERHVLGRTLHAADEPEFVVALDRHRAQVVLDARAVEPGLEVVAHFPLVGAGQLAPQEGRHVLGLDGVDRREGERGLERLEVGLAEKDHVGGVLPLHEAPVIAGPEVAYRRTVLPGEAVEQTVEPPYGEGLANACARAKSAMSTKAFSSRA